MFTTSARKLRIYMGSRQLKITFRAKATERQDRKKG